MKRFFAVLCAAVCIATLWLFAFYVFPVAADTLWGKSTALALAEKEMEARGKSGKLDSVNDWGNCRYGVIYLAGPKRFDVTIESGKVAKFLEWENPHAK